MNDRPGNGGPEGVFPPPDFNLQNVDLSQLSSVARLAVVALVVVGLFLLLGWAVSFRVDWLWFQSLGYEDVLLKVVLTRVALFVVGAAGFVIFAGGNLAVAFRDGDASLLGSTAEKARRGLGWVATAAVLVVGVLLGNLLGGGWETMLRWRNAVAFGRADPVFGLDLGFFVFTLPLLQLLRGWFVAAVALTLLFVGGAYLSLTHLTPRRFGSARPRRIHLAALGATLGGLVAAGHWLDRYLTLYGEGGAVHGVGYREFHASIPAHTFLVGVALIASVALLVGAVWNSRRMMISAPIAWLVLAFAAAGVYPGFVQRFQVEPNELARERPFLANHIELTRLAYGLERMRSQSHPARGEIDAATIEANEGTVQNVRLWDEGPLRQSYNQIQFFRLYYDFLRVFTDRYQIGGQLRQVMLSTRELSPEKLPEEAQRWVNRHLQFTHGYGVAMSPVTEVAPDGRPAFFLKDVPPQGEVELTRPEVYYGLKSLEYVVADTRMEEFNYPGADGPVYSHYDGAGGVAIGGLLRRAMYAWQFGDLNLLISEEIESGSRIQYRRTIGERISQVAPFLRLDASPYVVVAGGRLMWMQDAYTVTDYFPYSLPWQRRFNYIRNSVKVVVDAYDGSVDFYVAEPDDPLIQAYQGMFPGLFKPLEQMPAELQAHIRYPRDIFSVQVQMLLQYHMEDPVVFYNKEDQWSLPQETSFEQSRVLEPYYIVARLPGVEREEFLLIQPFTPANRHNLVAWIAARNDPPNYGELVLFQFPSGRHLDGPNQVEARIDNDPVISEQFTLWGQVGSEVSRGNLLVIPLGDSILYAEPIFLRPETLEFPELRRIILADARSVVMHPTLDRSVAALVGELPAVAAPAETGEFAPPTGTTPGPPAAESPPAMTREELDEIVRSLEDTIRSLQELLEQLRRQRSGGPGG